MSIKSISQSSLANKTVIVRVDYNVPLSSNGRGYVVRDPRRIQASFHTVETLLRLNCKIILISHLGRPEKNDQNKFSLQPVYNYLRRATKWPLQFVPDYTDTKATKKLIADSPAGSVFLFENLRFHPGEKKNDPAFVKLLASYADAYVNDAFSSSHRAHASVYGLAKKLPACGGLALCSEVEAFSHLLAAPAHPFVVVVGGAKISDKIDPIVNLSKIADAVLIGGGVANNFLKAVGLAVQKSYLQDTPADLRKVGLDYVDLADQIITQNRSRRLLKDGYIPLPKIIYPVDVIAAPNMTSKKTSVVELTSNDDICERCQNMYLDIGPKTTKLYRELILQAETVFWNGPMGIFEQPQFATGTREVARAVAKTGGVTLAGGGDTLAALDKFGYSQQVDYVSMAGSAALEFLAGKKLPGLEVLEKK